MARTKREIEQDPVVIVGFAFRFPQDAVSEDDFWNIIRRGSSTMTEVPLSRYNINGHQSSRPGVQDAAIPRGGHFIKGDVSAFDAPFFKMSSAEAMAMDPQLRLLLETTYHAFESAGMPIENIQGSNTSVYVGNLVQEYGAMFAYDGELNPKYQATGVSSAMLSNRLSWFYDLQGSSVSIDTACSSSLVGLHLACQDLLQGHSDMDGRTPSISQPSSAAQASLIHNTYESAGLDFDSTGYFEAHGTGTAVGDPIEARAISQAFSRHRSTKEPIYVGSVKANIGHLEPLAGVAGVIKCILMLERGEITPNAMLRSLNPRIEADEWGLKFPTSVMPWPRNGLRRASVNSFGFGGTNGHAVVDDALHYLQVRGIQAAHNTSSSLSCDPAVTSLRPDVIEAHEKLLFLLSASDEAGIQRQAKALEEYLSQSDKTFPESFLRNLAFTLSNKRSMLPWKCAIQASSVNELCKSLSEGLPKPIRSSPAEKRLLCFVFTGQGAQWATMGLDLLEYTEFKNSLEHADLCFKSMGSEWSLLEELRSPASTSRIDDPDLAQPLCTALQIALIDLLACWNLLPDAVTGHSSGEIAAAYCSGSLDKESALKVAFFRGRLVSSLVSSLVNADQPTAGGMLAVGLSEEKLEPYISSIRREGEDDPISIVCGCINSPVSTTVTGSSKLLEKLASMLEADQIFSRKLKVPLAYHSPQMTAVANSYRQCLSGHLKSPAVASSNAQRPIFFSSVSGQVETPEQLARPDYWVENLVSQVKFSDALRLMCSTITQRHGVHVKPLISLLEVGPHCSLERPIRDTLANDFDHAYTYVLRRYSSAIDCIKAMATKMLVGGHTIDILAVNTPRQGQPQPLMLVNLPKYQFNSSQSYWTESRMSKNMRFRETTRHELLGIRSVDWNPMKPTWRLVIRQSDLPWVTHHQIDNTVLYPAAGMLVMVLEGVRSMFTSSKVSGYRLRDVNIGSALIIPTTDEGVEAQLHMSSRETSANKETRAWDFWIHSVTGDEWKLHCSGKVSAEETFASDSVSMITESDLHIPNKECLSIIGKTQFYQSLWTKGAHFGELFQTLYDIGFDEGGFKATATLPFSHWVEKVKEGKLSEHLIHPSTLDGMIHVLFASVWNDLSSLPTMVPTQFREVYISQTLLTTERGREMKLYGDVDRRDIFSMEGNVLAISTTTNKPLAYFRGLRLLGFHSNNTQGSNTSLIEPISLFHQIDWKPDISLLSQRNIEDYCVDYTRDMARGGHDKMTELICRQFLRTALQTLNSDTQKTLKSHQKKYIRWANSFLEQEKQSTNMLEETWPESVDMTTREDFIDKYASSMQQKKLLVSFGRRLFSMITGQLDALEPLFNEGLGESFYQTPLFNLTAHRLAGFMDLLAHKNSDIKIIEIGAGTGSTTLPVLNALSRHGRFPGKSLRDRQYDFTDISPAFFAKAQTRFASYSEQMSFKTLDIERDPEEQGFEGGSYDVVIAAAVLHATSDIDNTLSNIKKLLKPRGYLVFSEPTNRHMATIPFLFGLLPGWWLSTEEYRSAGPLLSRPEWNRALLRAGFDELSVSLPDDEEEFHGISLLVAQATCRSETCLSTPPAIIPEASLSMVIIIETPDQKRLADDLHGLIVSLPGITCEIVDIDSVATRSTIYDQCICLMEAGTNVLSRMTNAQFKALGHLIEISKKIIWVTDDCGEAAKSPESAASLGFGSTMMRERPKLSWVNLSLQSGSSKAENILQIVDQSRRLSPEEQETQITEADGRMLIPRTVEAPHLNNLLESELSGSQPWPLEVGKKDLEFNGELELRFSPGRLDSFHFGPDSLASLPLREKEVRISVRATGINFKDVMVALNQVADDHIGQEFSGVVVEVGSDLQNIYRIGDRVCGIASTTGSFRDILRAKESHLMRMPAGMSFAEASSIPVAYATAQYGLHHLARLQSGDSILIHAAAGAVGQAAIHLAKRIGALVFVTVSTPEKKQFLMDRFGIEPSYMFSSRHTFFAQQLMQRTGGRGVDVVLNSLTGQALAESWRCVAPFGRFIEIGKRDIATFNSLPMEPLMRNISFCSLDLAAVSKFKDALMSQIMQEVQDGVLSETPQNSVAPYPLTMFKRSQFEDAFRLLQTGRHIGKVVIDWEQRDTIFVVPKSPLDYSFDSAATYVISGGLGGIGRSIAEWLVHNGAKNLVLLSRSGPRSDSARQLVSKLERDGAYVFAPQCDVSSAEMVKTVFGDIAARMPPIKGCIQASMVVENRIFENYDLESFQSALDPKITGTYNLYHHLPPDLDFFVLLSSLASIHGAASQSNYAAANSFLDAFARFVNAQGRRCTSINLGIVDSVGYIAERLEVARNMNMAYVDHKVVRQSDLHFLLKYACNPSLNNPETPWEAQILAALTTPAFVRRGGVLQDHSWMRAPLFRHLYRMELQNSDDSKAADQVESAGSQLREAKNLAEAASLVTKLFARRLARSLAVPVEDIDVNRPPYAFSVDSLVAVELLFWFSSEIHADVPVVQILGNLTIAQLGKVAAEKSQFVQGKTT